MLEILRIDNKLKNTKIKDMQMTRRIMQLE